MKNPEDDVVYGVGQPEAARKSKYLLTIRFDADVISAFKAVGEG